MNGPGHQDPISMRRERKLGARLQTAAPEASSPRPAIEAKRAPMLRTVGPITAKSRDVRAPQACERDVPGRTPAIVPETNVLTTSHTDQSKTLAQVLRGLLAVTDRTARISMDAVLMLVF